MTTTTNTNLVAAARKLADEGKTKAQVKGYLLMEGLAEAEAGDILRELGLTRKMGDFREWLYTELAKGPMTKEAFKAALKDATENSKKHESHYWGIVELVNKVHGRKTK
jgi:hypothetical protein